jgi:hypothetical protein
MILGVQFAKKMGMLDFKLQKSMWQICTANGNAEEVLGESSDLIALNFNKGIDQEFCLHVRCLITNATSCDVLIGQEALFPPSFTIDNWFEHVTIEWIGRLMATTWDTYPFIYMGTIVLWLTIVCSRKHTPFPTSNKLVTNE